jgi:hypothetical protein
MAPEAPAFVSIDRVLDARGELRVHGAALGQSNAELRMTLVDVAAQWRYLAENAEARATLDAGPPGRLQRLSVSGFVR